MRGVVMMSGAEFSATKVSLTALTERFDSDAANLPGQKCFSPMIFQLPAGELQSSQQKVETWYMED